ncbi:MAG: thiamine pyrophosphate-binding protein [Hyphomicrobiales bacterium]|nr:thiamine pyrophosphate-binding protein [Hyphomicrobiales bacterium]
MTERTGGQVLADQLQAQGVETVFCVPGESYLALLDGLRDTTIRTIVCRHEAGAGMMAEADAKLTGRTAVVCVSRGPGATNVAHAVHIAEQDSTPLLVIVGQVNRGFRGRGASQEIDCDGLFGGMAKCITEIRDPARIPEAVRHAFHVSMQGRPGAVVLAVPEDMLYEKVSISDAVAASIPDPWPSPADRDGLRRLMAQSERPLAILGGSRWSPEASKAIQRFMEAWSIPVTCSFRRQMLYDARTLNYVGEFGHRPNPDLIKLANESDLVLLVGGRLNDVPSLDYTLLADAPGNRRVIHVHPDGAELGRVYQADLAIACSPHAFAASIDGILPDAPRRKRRVEQARQSYVAWSGAVPRSPGRLQMGEIMRFLREALPPDAILTNGAGNYATWPQRFYRYSGFGTQLAPVSGSMGYGVPAAIAAKLRYPERTVVAFAGDGCFQMTGQEFATAVQYDIPIIVVVIDNRMLGSIRMHQEQRFPGREFATALTRLDFSRLAEAYGGIGETVETAGEFEAAFLRALASGRPTILHCHLSPEALTVNATLREIRERAMRARNMER